MLQKLPSLAAETTTETKTSSSAAAGKLLKTNRETKKANSRKKSQNFTQKALKILLIMPAQTETHTQKTHGTFPVFKFDWIPFLKTNINFSSIINKISSNGLPIHFKL